MSLEPAPAWTFTAWKAFTAGLASRQVLKQAAFVRDLEVQTLPSSFYVISDGRDSHGFWNQTPETTSLVARNVSTSKHVAKAVLERAGIRVPVGDVFRRDDIESAWRFAKSIGVPVVVKPTAKSGGAGVTSEIATEEHFRLAWTTAQAVSAKGRIIVERHVRGKDFRLYVVGDRVVATTHRVPAYVEGNGQSSVAELVERKNKVRRANPDVGFKPIKLTPPIRRNLTEMGLTPDSVLIPGRRVTLHPIANIGAGGESVDVSDVVHPDFREIAVRARKTLPGAASGGVDLLVEDLSAPARTQDWAVCELNTSPEIALHHFPVVGTPRDVAGTLIEHFFPGRRPCEPADQRGVRAVIDGDVTGKGFRRWIWRRAHLRGLTGWVRNWDDSSVEAAFRGAPRAVEDMLELCRAGSSKTAVERVAVEAWPKASTDDLRDFEIRS